MRQCNLVESLLPSPRMAGEGSGCERVLSQARIALPVGERTLDGHRSGGIGEKG
jgi:hypothetical protein